MIGFLQGKVISCDGSKLVILTSSGVGYEINYGYFAKASEEVGIHIHHHISENDQSLWGFNTLEDKKMIKKGIKRGSAKTKGLSRSNDYIKDIPLGDFTKLNTQEFEFYGFYHRIRQKLEQFWGRNIQDQADKIIKQGRSIASGTNHVTALQIELNERGEIVKVRVNAASGVKELDNTAIRTFNEAGPFPNPPKKMLKNGRAYINWSFVVNT